jgi:hypothetical protein
MKAICYAVQTRDGNFVALNGDFTNFVSESLVFLKREDAVRCSFRFLASRVVELSTVVTDRAYQTEQTREHVNFISTRWN